jgi:L-lactate dehydrogenase complex protein LldG
MNVETRLAQKPRGIVPMRGQLEHEERIALFCQQARNVQADVERVGEISAIGPLIATYLNSQDQSVQLRGGDAAVLHKIDWQAHNISLTHGPSAGNDAHSISVAVCGCAETGSLVLLSGRDNPTTLNFLPDTHIVLIEAQTIDPHFEDIWHRLRGHFGNGPLPRTINMITGPSRSADIEQTMLLGAHGPRRLLIVVIG